MKAGKKIEKKVTQRSGAHPASNLKKGYRSPGSRNKKKT